MHRREAASEHSPPPPPRPRPLPPQGVARDPGTGGPVASGAWGPLPEQGALAGVSPGDSQVAQTRPCSQGLPVEGTVWGPQLWALRIHSANTVCQPQAGPGGALGRWSCWPHPACLQEVAGSGWLRERQGPCFSVCVWGGFCRILHHNSSSPLHPLGFHGDLDPCSVWGVGVGRLPMHPAWGLSHSTGQDLVLLTPGPWVLEMLGLKSRSYALCPKGSGFCL